MGKFLRQKSTNVIAVFLLFVGILAAFTFFSSQNTAREMEETRATIREAAFLKVQRIEETFDDRLYALGDMAYIYGETASADMVDLERLAELEVNTHFDYVRFVDKDGITHASSGKESQVSDRDYFIDGMKGNQGICFIENSRVNGDDLIGFYTPVYIQDEIVGVVLGACDTEQVSELLSGVFQGYRAEALLCTSDGDVISSVYNQFGNGFFDVLADRRYFTSASEASIREAFEESQATSFSYTTDLGETTGFIQPMGLNDWFLVQFYPDQALYGNINAANKTGLEFFYIVLVLFVVYVIYLFINFLASRKALENANRHSRNISRAMQTILNRFVEIDVENGTYEYLTSMPFKNEIPDKGNYSVFAKYIASKVIEVDDRESLEKSLSLEELVKCFTPDVDYVSYLLHAIWEEEKYENLTFVCIKRDEQRRPTTLICMRMDVTQSQRMERESKVALQEAYNSAEEANRAKSDFLSRMSHDIRTPLNAITGMTNIARLHMEDKDKVLDCLDKIESSSSHLLNLVNEVLDMSKIESGKMCLAEEPYDLNEVIDHIANIMAPHAKAKDIQFNVKRDNINHTLLMGDSTRLEQLIINIMSNAIKFTPEKGTVTLEFEESICIAKGYAKYKIRCTDTGIGMDEETAKNVFDPFYRAKKSSNKIEGTGLGMSIAKNIANMMNGDIEVETTPGKGTTFKVTIYQKKQNQPVKSEGDTEEIPIPDYSEKRALIVEDNEINMEIAETLLGVTGIKIDKASDGSYGYYQVLNTPENYYDIVFMDIQMPNLNGYECASAIRSINRPDAKEIPIIAMSADAFVEDIHKAKMNGMNDHISKPIDVNRLLQVMKKYL